MSKGQVAIAELQKRVGPCDPVQGFRLIDAVLAERQAHLGLWEQLLMGIAFDRGALIAAVTGLWQTDPYVDDDGAVESLRDACVLLKLDVPLITATEQPLVRPSRLIQ